jgi:predicted flap endonuclease-1-like 5' DNA nuclease
MPKPRQSAVEDSHELEALSTENIKRTSEYSIFPPSPNPMPSQVIAPIPVLTLSPIETPKVASSELKLVRGIGDKRAEQLKGFGISNIDDLAHASASDIATKLMTSPKIVEKWIARARELSE